MTPDMRVLRWNSTRCLLAFLILVYAALSVLVHRVNVHSTPSGLEARIAYFQNPFEKYNVLLKRDESTLSYSTNATQFPAPRDWENYLFEGRNNDNRDGKNLWDYTDLPTWMKDYFDWHREKRNELDQSRETWTRLRYYIVECSDKFETCGGAADRLGPLPFHIRMAATYERLLLISWRDDRPAPLETFLIPPRGGIDWRLPPWLLQKFQQVDQHRRIATYLDKILRWGPDNEARWLRVKYQSHDHGRVPFDRKRISSHDPTFAQVFHDVWRIFFTPTQPIAERIEAELQTLGLFPGSYISVHLRALYGVESRDEALIRGWAQNALRCATSRLPHVASPILFVSDSVIAKNEAINFGKKHGLPVVHRLANHEQEPLHLEKDKSSTNLEDFYDTFVDMLMIGLSRCTSQHIGGFGRLGSLISYNASCSFRMKAAMESCDLQEYPLPERKSNLSDPATFLSPLFIPGIMGGRDGAQTESALAEVEVFEQGFNFSKLSFSLQKGVYNYPLMYEDYNATKLGVNIWARSATIPVWMKRYFKWHKQQRVHKLNPENWKSMRFLVMECLRHHPKCGGTSDRLKPLPTLLRLAASTKRFLLIHWTRPCRLEEFLLPPRGGVDWRVPDWLHLHLIDNGSQVTVVDSVSELAESDMQIVRTKYQSYDGGQGWYNEDLKANETAFNEVFHDVWRVFFTPSPPIATRIHAEMKRNGLVPGEYVSAHLRALYTQDARSAGQTKAWTRNAINCATKLKPGRPVFFASDSKVASDYSVQYGQEMRGIVVTHVNNPDPPLHLDKAENFSDVSASRLPVSHYYDTWVDLYLLALGRCVYLSKGGYGHWGLLIGGNTTCVMKFKRGKHGIVNPCNWTAPIDDRSVVKHPSLTEPPFIEPEW